MRRARFSEEQIITILKEAEGGAKVTELLTRPAEVYRPAVEFLTSVVGWCRYFRRLLHSTDLIDNL